MAIFADGLCKVLVLLLPRLLPSPPAMPWGENGASRCTPRKELSGCARFVLSHLLFVKSLVPSEHLCVVAMRIALQAYYWLPQRAQSAVPRCVFLSCPPQDQQW